MFVEDEFSSAGVVEEEFSSAGVVEDESVDVVVLGFVVVSWLFGSVG